MTLYPVILFTYNRLEHTKKAVASLLANKLSSQTKLYICSDGPRNTEDVPKVKACRDYFSRIKGFLDVEVVELSENHNVKRAVKLMGDMLSSKYEAWIAIEDDVLVHSLFLQFMNDALNYYKSNSEILLVNAYAHERAFRNALIKKNYPYDVIFGMAFHCFGWGIWSDKWKNIDLNMPEEHYFKGLGNKFSIFNRSWGHLMSHKVASRPTSELWDIHVTYYMLKNNMVAVWPVRGYLCNIGFDGTGIHGYNFSDSIFCEELSPKDNLNFTMDIALSRRYDFAIYSQVAIKWVKAFLGNFLRVIFRLEKKQVINEEEILSTIVDKTN